MKRSILTSLSVVALSALTMGQHVLCGTDEERARLIAQNPEYLEQEAIFLQELNELIASSRDDRDEEVYRIPVVFHVLHLRGVENISNEQIYDAMDILNRDYDAANPDSTSIHPAFRNVFADMDIEFRLATIDPIGQCTNGIVRHQSTETFRGGEEGKLNPWPRSKYMNIWITRAIGSGAAGYFTYGSWSAQDGIMLLQNYTGAIGTGATFSSRALTHEVGHYLSLSHVWGGNNGVPDEDTPSWAMQSVCGDDGVEDTPFTRGWSSCVPATNNERSWADCEQTPFPDSTAYNFEAVTTSSGATDPSSTPDVARPEDGVTPMVNMGPMSAVGVSSDSEVDGAFAFTNWGTGAPDGATAFTELTGSFDASRYYQFQATPAAMVDRHSSINSFSFDMSRDTSGIRTFSVRGSLDNYNSNLPISVVGLGHTVLTGSNNNVVFVNEDTVTTVRIIVDPPKGVPGTPPQPAGYSPFQQLENALQATPVTFRIYAWNSEDPSGTFHIDSLVINGHSGLVENVENYMEYSYCSHMFTEGQRARARAALNSPTYQRDNLWNSNNLEATGTADGFQVLCAPEADFYAQVGPNPSEPAIPFPPMSCDNVNVRFVDNTANANVDTWAWTFQDGNPATSSVRNPTVQFTSSGWKTVSLTVTNAQGSSSKTDPYAVFIGGPDVASTAYYESFEDMEGTNLFPYTSFNYDNNLTQFMRYEGGGATGNACVMLNSGDRNQFDFIDPDNGGDYDDFVTPILNLQGAPSNSFSFRYAYSTNTAVVADVTEFLRISSSTDCGRTWQDLSNNTITGSTLVTNGNNNSLPPAEWRIKTFSLPGSLMNQDVRFRFRFVSSVFSGHLFLDDLWIGVPVGVDELSVDQLITLFPNPTTGTFTLQVVGMESSSTEVTITDLRGATVYQNTFQPNGSTYIEIDGRGAGLAEGLYMVRATNNTGSSAQKLMIGR